MDTILRSMDMVEVKGLKKKNENKKITDLDRQIDDTQREVECTLST